MDAGAARQALARAAVEDPCLARFCRRFPALGPAAAEVLERAAAVREARRLALPIEDRRVLRVRHPALAEAEGEMSQAVTELERLAAAGDGRGVAPAAERLARAVAAVRAHSHAFGEPRASLSPAGRQVLFRALAGLRRAHDELSRLAEANHVRKLPWQISFASHVAPGTPAGRLELDGYDLPQTPIMDSPWGERCWLSGTQFVGDSRRQPALRYRSLDSCAVLAPECFRLVERLRAACGCLAGESAAAIGRVVDLFPVLWEDFVADRWHPTFGKLGLLDYPSLAVSLNNIFRLYAERPCIGVRGRPGSYPTVGLADRRSVALEGATSGYGWLTYDEVRVLALRLSYALERLEMSAGSRLGLMASRNCPEILLGDFAAIFSGRVSVGLQHTLPDDDLGRVVARSALGALICDRESLRRIQASNSLRRELAACRLLVFDTEEPAGPGGRPEGEASELYDLLPAPVEVAGSWVSASGIGFDTELLYGDRESCEAAASRGIGEDADDDVYTVLFTSGSTGEPKGTIVTRRRWAEEMCYDADLWPQVSVSFQPQALAADRGIVWRALYSGGRVGLARRGADLLRDVRTVRPTVFDAPPVIWNTIYSEYKRAVGDAGLTAAEALRVKRRFKDYLGGRLAFIATGGAPSDPGVRRTMQEIFGIPLADSYGTTETGNIAVNGRLVAGLDYRLLPVPELGFTPDDQPYPRGELAVRTPHTTARYLHESEGASAGFTADGYFRTGDVVELGPDRRCSIIGRRKGFFKLAAGEFVSPEVLERHYATSELVETVFVTSLPLEPSVVAVVVPSRAGASEGELLAELRAIGQRRGLRAAEIPLAVVVEPRVARGLTWTVENGLLTPSLKLDRRRLAARYRERIEAAYAVAGELRRQPAAAAADAGPDPTAGRLRRIVASLVSLPEDEVDLDSSFLELGGDSVGAMELTLRLEQVFSGKGEVGDWRRVEPQWLVETPLREVAGWLAGAAGEAPAERSGGPPPQGSPAGRPGPTYGPSRLAADQTAAAPEPAEDWLAVANREADLVRLPKAWPPPAGERNVLLTGATGFLGVHVLHELVATLPPEARLYALVRADDDGAAGRRIERALADAGLPAATIGARGSDCRVVALAGSLERPGLGLPDAIYERLAAGVGLIYHAAAQVTAGAGYADLRAANVEGTRRLLELATTRTLKAFHFVSSLNVALLIERCSGRRSSEDSPLPERLTAEQFASSLAYSVTKWAGERMLQRLFAHGDGRWRASISRPALVTWASGSGFADPSNWLTRVLSSALQMRRGIGPDEVGVPFWVPETPVSARGIDMVPVDFVARAVRRLGELTLDGALPARSGAAPERAAVFHVSNLQPAERGQVTMPRLMDLLVAADLAHCGGGPGIRLVPFAEWAALAEIESAPVVPVLDQLRGMPPTPRTRAERFAAAVGGVTAAGCPPVEVTLLDSFVRAWYRRQGAAGKGPVAAASRVSPSGA